METNQAAWQVMVDVTDAEAYAALSRDRVWNSFAIADLVPPFRDYSQIAVAHQPGTDGYATCLVVQHPQVTVVSPYGAPQGVAEILARISLPEQPLIQAQAQHLPLLERQYQFQPGGRELLRMAVSAQTFLPPASAAGPAVERLSPTDLGALRELYSLYPENHFRADLLEHGLFYGTRAGERIIAAGGTHVVADAYGIVVLGNILTHPDARRQGYGRAITAGLVSNLLGQGFRDIVLNVTADNAPAIQLYTRLGFQTHCSFWSTQARRREE